MSRTNDRNIRYQWVAFTLLMTVFVGFWLTRSPPPPDRSVDGIYESACCGVIALDGGVMRFAKRQISFRVLDMKFGRVLAPIESVQVDGGHRIAIGRTDPNLVPYDVAKSTFELGGVFQTPTSMEFYQFRRVHSLPFGAQSPTS